MTDQSTARCPQCGAAIRSSARFCVTCGIMLPNADRSPDSPGRATDGWIPRESDHIEPAAAVTPALVESTTLVPEWDQSPTGDTGPDIRTVPTSGTAQSAGQPRADEIGQTAIAQKAAPELTTGVALSQIAQLLEELQALLPALATPPAETVSVDLTPIRTELAAIQRESASEQFSLLRAVVSDVLAGPRDVDAVLRLAQRIEEIDRLLIDRDHLWQGLARISAGIEALTAATGSRPEEA